MMQALSTVLPPQFRAGGGLYFLVLAFLFLSSQSTFAHELRPAYLQLRQTGPETFDVIWKVPERSGMRFALYVQLPQDCVNLSQPRGYVAAGSFTEHWNIRRKGGLSGSKISITGLSSTLTDVLVRVERTDGSTQITRLTASAPSFIVEATPRVSEVARTYLTLGIEHILTGADHLLFVSGLLLLVVGFKNLLKTISAFTLSHSVTLTLATLGFVYVPPAPVEGVIALSILFVACEILKGNSGHPNLAHRKPWLVAFTFGLLHGLGFAGGLSAAGLPVGHIPLALAFFSAGVEVGHFSFVALAFGLMLLFRRWKSIAPVWAWRVPPYAIGSMAAYWLIARLAAF